ncbi:MAG: CBASS oligonucleotide cyclase [Bacillota bacterium]|nr:CBASS oligonucleotide cyclase [Bacillota bacterium]
MSGGHGRYAGPTTQSVRQQIDEAWRRELEGLIGDVNELLRQLLLRYNDRDREKIKQRLDELAGHIGDTAEVDRVLFGGSIAKHTDVDGLSDTDALVVLDREAVKGETPADLLAQFEEVLDVNLPRHDVRSVNVGRLAVTVVYLDGEEIQLLPALRSGNAVQIASEDGTRWRPTHPRRFEHRLTEANARMDGAVIPTIKLVKSMISELPPQKQLRSHHIEALAIDAVTAYQGPKTPRSLVLQFLGHAATRVLSPLRDVTGQSETIDDYLGLAGSTERQIISQALAALGRRLESATSVKEWRAVLGVGDNV